MIIYLGLQLLVNSSDLPVSQHYETYLVFHRVEVYLISCVTTQTRGLLPHIFTLTPRGGILSVALVLFCYAERLALPTTLFLVFGLSSTRGSRA